MTYSACARIKVFVCVLALMVSTFLVTTSYAAGESEFLLEALISACTFGNVEKAQELLAKEPTSMVWVSWTERR